MLDALAAVVMDGEDVLVAELLLTSDAADGLVVLGDLLGAGEQLAAQGAPGAPGEHPTLGVLQVPVPGLRARGVVVPGEAGEVRGPGQLSHLREDGLALQL